jgi:uncharacterized protein (DUF1697 family)
MERYIAFLRGVNVSGQKTVKMEQLRKVISDAGFFNVKTYIQSGNLLFDTDETEPVKLQVLIENLIETSFGFRTDVILRRLADIEVIVNSPFFSQLKSEDEKKYYITFLKTAYPTSIDLPLFSKNKDVEIYRYDGMEMFSVCTSHKGVFGFPNAIIEKITGTPATTRNPLTLKKILEL